MPRKKKFALMVVTDQNVFDIMQGVINQYFCKNRKEKEK